MTEKEKFEALYRALKDEINELEKQFIQPFIPADPNVGPNQYGHLVKAYCILCHAAFEEYFEELAFEVMNLSIKHWFNKTNKVKSTETLMTLVCYYGLKLDIDDNDSQPDLVFDYLRKIFKEVKDKFSKYTKVENHGISIKYLKKLLLPVAIDIKRDAMLLNSLQQLASERGAYAHKRVSQKILTPDDAKNIVEDCLKLCEDVKEKAIAQFQ
jgi:hypothetical protein